MSKNPFLNAFAASIYIVLVVLLMTFATSTEVPANSFIAPLMMISLFTLSTAVMGYIFGYQPLQLYLDGKKKRAVKLFLQTVGIFGGITLLLFILSLTGILS